MSAEEARLIYTTLVDNDELESLLPGAVGEWSSDKEAFLHMYKKNQEAIELLSLDIDIDLDGYEDL